MAKILVADDNSNIQKMVGLALKDQGIEVVAVGNGEAAVRKIPDIRPDVVLADVFMPVRNGYEVCEFIKKHEKLAHIPVILLVGAFDPLDEQEAQRVGADGVLKKPFVPPEPLISMVKSALSRAGANAPVAVAGGLPTAKSIPGAAMAPVIPSFPSPPASELPSAEVLPKATAYVAEDAPPRPQPFAIDEGHKPVAFGSLLDAAAEKKEAETDESFLPASHPKLTEERKWNAPPAEEEEEPEGTPSWRTSIDDLFDSPATAETKAVSDWRDIVPSAPPQDAAPTVEASALEEAQSLSGSAIPESPPAYWQDEQEAASVEPAPAEEAKPEALPEPASPPPSFTPENFPGLFVEERTPLVPEPVEETQEPLIEQEFIPPASAAGNWEEEVRRAARLVTTWETDPSASQLASPSDELASPVSEISRGGSEPTPRAPAASSPFELPADEAATRPSDETQWPSHRATLSEPSPPAQFDAPDWYRKFQAAPATEEQQEAAPAPPTTEPAQTLDMDALVAKVLQKMNPNVLQQVTREILKPVIEALVRDELDKKK